MTASFEETMRELGNLLSANDCPGEVVDAASGLLQSPDKLFWFVPKGDLAIRAPNLGAGLQPSDLLLELVQAVRALEWPKVLVLIHRALPLPAIEGQQREIRQFAPMWQRPK